jgi:hypothetical protein
MKYKSAHLGSYLLCESYWRFLFCILDSECNQLVSVPVQLFINEQGLAKLQIALAKGKKLYDNVLINTSRKKKNILQHKTYVTRKIEFLPWPK